MKWPRAFRLHVACWIRQTSEKISLLYRFRIGRRLSACLTLIIALMLGGSCFLLWQFHLVQIEEERLNAVDQQLLAVLRVHAGLISFYERLETISDVEDPERLVLETGPLRDALLQDTRRIKDSLSRVPGEAGADPTLLPTLQTIESALPSQLEVISALAQSGDWPAVKLRLENEVRPLENLTSALVQNADQQVVQVRDQAMLNTRRAQRRILLIVPTTALLTLFIASILGWVITRSITDPLNRLMRASQALARGEFDERVSINGTDELAHLGTVFNDTSRTLGELYDTLRNREEKLRQDERELRRITDAIPQLILVHAPDGSVLHANQLAREYWGLTPEDFSSPDFPERLVHPDDLQRVLLEREGGFAQGGPFETEQRFRRNDGQPRWFLVRYNPLRDEQGKIIRWYATGTDIEDRKRAEVRALNENLALREEIDRSSMFEEIVGSSEALRKVLGQIARVAQTDSTVLIQGETGTGKELIARAIHRRSKRATRAFIRVNCAAIPPSLIASELFGHEKGAFTGATQRRLGRFESADGGTIFLDEIGDLPAETQITLLRVLQEREFERVGSSQPVSVNVRVLAATNRDLQAAVAVGSFREDLFYRLNVFPIIVPSLRERKGDIPLLLEYLIERYAGRAGKRITRIETKTLEQCQAYDWPGNIRELQNVVERAVILCEGDSFSVEESWLKRETPGASPQPTFEERGLARLDAAREREIIEAALAASQGRVSGPSGAAVKLGIPRQTLESKILSLGINKRRFQRGSTSGKTVE